MWCHGTVAELLGEAGLCRCARMPDAAYVQVTDCYWREAAVRIVTDYGMSVVEAKADRPAHYLSVDHLLTSLRRSDH